MREGNQDRPHQAISQEARQRKGGLLWRKRWLPFLNGNQACRLNRLIIDLFEVSDAIQ
jgi:hypothetical protein